MSIELPVLRLGLAGFGVEQKAALNAMLQRSAPGRHVWQIGSFTDADAWWIHGARAQLAGRQTIRITPAIPTERSLQINVEEADRPMAFSVPLAFTPFEPHNSFDPASLSSVNNVLEKFESWLQPVAAQFSLAGRILEHESVLGSGIYHVMLGQRLLAIVDMHGEVGVIPSAGPADFDDAMWVRQPGASQIPEAFVRASLSELMWQYAVRTTRDVLPKRYRDRTLYFRRAPRIAQRLLSDSHLLVIRELAAGSANFMELQQHTGMGADALARVLAALYLVGTVTSDPKRASVTTAAARTPEPEPSQGSQHSIVPSGMDSETASQTGRRFGLADFTVAMPIEPL